MALHLRSRKGQAFPGSLIRADIIRALAARLRLGVFLRISSSSARIRARPGPAFCFVTAPPFLVAATAFCFCARNREIWRDSSRFSRSSGSGSHSIRSACRRPSHSLSCRSINMPPPSCRRPYSSIDISTGCWLPDFRNRRRFAWSRGHAFFARSALPPGGIRQKGSSPPLNSPSAPARISGTRDVCAFGFGASRSLCLFHRRARYLTKSVVGSTS